MRESDSQPPLYSLSTAAIDASRRVDNIEDMAREIAPARPKETRKILGVSIPIELASKVKAEAGRRHISLRNLFIEMWQLYEKYGSGKKKS